MSMIHPAMLNVRNGVEQRHRADVEVRQYVSSEYCQKDGSWIVSSCAGGSAPSGARVEATASVPSPATSRATAGKKAGKAHLIVEGLSQNRLTKWLLPRADGVGER